MIYSLVGLVVFGLLAAELLWLFRWAQGSWADKISVILAVTGAYGLGIGFFSSSPALRGFADSAKDLTSTNLVDYVVGNLIFMSFVLFFVSLGLGSKTEAGTPQGLRFVGTVLWLLLFPVALAYAALHLLVVVPVTYVPNFIASALVAAIAHAGGDVEIAASREGAETGRASIKEIIKHDQIAAKGFFLGIPSIVVSFLGQVLPPVIGA